MIPPLGNIYHFCLIFSGKRETVISPFTKVIEKLASIKDNLSTLFICDFHGWNADLEETLNFVFVEKFPNKLNEFFVLIILKILYVLINLFDLFFHFNPFGETRRFFNELGFNCKK